MGRMLNDITRLVGERKADQAGFDQREQQFRATVADKDKEIQRLQSERDALQSAKAQQERDLRDQINSLTEAKRTAEENLAAEQKTSKEAQAKLNNSILALKQDVQKLKQKKRMTEVPPGPDGEVLAVTSDQGIAILNRGKADHLKPGTTFEVYSIGKGARKIYKGTVLVLDVDTNKATARIEQVVNPADPIVQGDLIESVTYNPAQELHFYLLGRMQKYGKTDAAARLRQLGLKVDDSVTIDTDYVVMGAPESDTDDLRATDAYKRAQELGIPVIREQDLSRFVNY
jgi:NAD-dependent DNA ligase